MPLLLALAVAHAAPEKAPAAKPAPATTAPAAPAATAPADRAGLAVEPGLALTYPLPTAGLGPGPGLRVLVDAGVAPRLTVGGEVAVRAPGVASGVVGGDALAEDLDWRTGLTVLVGGARVAYQFGPLDGLRGRVALAGGLAWVAQDTVTQVGRTHDAALTGWIQPELGGLYPVGPGDLTLDLLVPVAPAPLLVLGDAPGGTGLGLAFGYRIPL